MQNKNVSQEVINIINIYKKINNFIFKPWLYILLFLLTTTFIVFADLDKHNDYISNNNTEKVWLIEIEWWYKANKIFIPENLEINWLNINILWWSIYFSWDNLISSNNIISYSWFVIPSNKEISNSLINNAELIANNSYWKNEIEEVIRENLSWNSWFSSIEAANLRWIRWNDIINHFWLSCIESIKISSYLCNKNINNFIENFYLYNIRADLEWFKNIYRNSNITQKELICEWILKHQQRNQINDDYIIEIWNLCSDTIQKNIIKSSEFISFVKEERSNLTSRVYHNNDINNYKILSFQSKIFRDRTDIRLISSYLTFVEELLGRRELNQNYIDIVYYYNNRYLNNFISSIRSSNQRQERDQSLDRISWILNNINNWNRISWYVWISNTANKDLVSYFEWSQHWSAWNNRPVTFLAIYENYISRTNNYSELNRNINNSLRKVQSSGILNVWEKNVNIEFILKNEWSQFYIESLKLNSNKEIEEDLNRYIKNDNITINNLINYMERANILNNFNPWQVVVNICDELKIEFNRLEITCSQSQITIIDWWDKNILNLNWQVLVWFQSSNKEIEIKWNDLINNNNIFWINIIDFYYDINSSNNNIANEDDNEEEWFDINEVNYINRLISWMFGSDVKIISNKSNRLYNIEFNIKWLNINWDLNIWNNNKLNNIIITNRNDAQLSWFEINLVSNNQTLINQIKNDPISVFKNFNSDLE